MHSGGQKSQTARDGAWFGTQGGGARRAAGQEIWIASFAFCSRAQEAWFARRLRPKNKSVLNSRSGRLGSPPPELPNHDSDSRAEREKCKCHLGNRGGMSQ